MVAVYLAYIGRLFGTNTENMELYIISTALHLITYLIGISLNILLIFAVVKKTPSNMSTYSVLILNFAITDLLSCVASMIVQQRIIPGGVGLFYISYGPCRYLGPSACFITHWLWSLLYSFWYRYYIISNGQPSRCKVKGMLLLIYIPSFLQFVFFCFTLDSESLVKQRLSQVFNYDVRNECASGHLNIFTWPVLGTILHMTLPVTPVYTAILLLRRGIAAKLQTETSEQTRHLHRQLLKAITYQACIPIFFWLAVLAYALGQLNILHHPIVEYSVFIFFGFVPAFSPLSSFYCIRPYRMWLMRRFTIIRDSWSSYHE